MSRNNAFNGNNNVCPVGSIIYWAGKTALKETVPGFLQCDGRSLEQDDFPELFRALGTRYGTGSGTTTFSLPDPTGQFLIGGAATDAGDIVPPSRSAFATATFSIADQTFLPPFDMDYDGAYAGTNNYYLDGVGNQDLYTDSSTGLRSTTPGDKFVRDDITYQNDGGVGTQETNPQIIFNTGSTPNPIDVTAAISPPVSYEAPSFNIIAMIKVKN